MRVRVLGGFGIEGVTDRDLGSRKARTLLKLLTVRQGRPVSIDTIAEVLWEDDQPAKPGDQVGVLISRLRAVLGAERIVRTDAGYTLHVDWVDIDEVDALTNAAAGALTEGRIGSARAAAHAALALARGPLLGDESGTWIEPQRASANALVTRARRVAVDAATAAGDLDGVVAIAESILAVDPYDEVVLRALMGAHVSARRPASALAAYARQRERMAEDLGVPPTAETEALHAEALRAADGDRPSPPPEPAHAQGVTRTSVVGRAAHHAALDAELRTIRDGSSGLTLVTGEAGMGKTTVVESWIEQLPDDVVVVRGRCDELGRDLPLQPIADALADHLRSVGPDATRDILDTDADVLAPLLGPLAGTGTAAATAVSDPEQGRLRVFAALLAAFTRAAGARPIVLVIEDLHIAAASTVTWLAFAHRRAVSTLLLATSRGTPPGLAPSSTLRVEALTLDDVTDLVGPEGAADAFERTGGHPLLLRALAPSTGEGMTAETFDDVVAAQLATVGDDAARTTQIAAMVGLECDVELVSSVRSVATVDVLLHLEAAATTGLIVEQGNGFEFRHNLIREAVNTTLSAPQSRALHREVALALSRRPRVDPLAVAIHARAGGALDLAASSFIAAAEAAAGRFDVETAEAYLASAIDAAPDLPDAYVVRARIRMSRSSFEDAEHDAAVAIERGGGAAAFEVAGWVAYYRRSYERALTLADEAIARAGPDSPLRVSASALAGRVRHGAGDLLGALAHLDAPGEAPLAIRGVADVWLAQARLHQGRPTDALAALARPLVAPDSLAHPWAPLHLRFNRAMALGQLGRVAEALEAAAELRQVAQREGAVGRRFVAPAENVASWLLRWSGQPDEADQRSLAAVEATGGAGGPSAEGFAEGHYVALLDLADGALLREDAAAAHALLAERLAAVDQWTGTMSWHQRHRLNLARSRLALASGDRETAAGLAMNVARDAAARGAARYELLAFAYAALADDDIPVSRLAPVVEGLGRCALLDGWVLVATLARARDVDAWRREAERRAAAMVAASGDGADAARRFVDRMLSV